MFERDLVFIGGGHTHALVLRMLAMKPQINSRLTLITDTLLTPYSGMLPGYMAGHYTLDETHIDLNKLCQATGIRLIHDRVTGIDVTKKTIQLANHSQLSYDKVSINTGSTPNLTIPGAQEYALGVKPVSQLTNMWRQLIAKEQTEQVPHWAVVGAGAAGIEVVLAIAHRFQTMARPIKLSLVHSGDQILPTYTEGAQRKAKQALKKYGIDRISNFNVARVEANRLVSNHDQYLYIDQSIWCTPAVAPTWPGSAGLSVDKRGFIEVNQYLQSTSHPDVFACGDVSAMTTDPRPKAGVFAVRSAPFLLHNLTAALTQKPMRPLKLQKDFLSLIALGEHKAVGMRSGLTFSGKWVWHWKDRIDQKFMRLFDDKLPRMNSSDMATDVMHCAGCGSKLGPELLNEVLSELNQDINQGQPTLAEDAALVLDTGEQQLWQSIDGFRSFTDDLYRLGQVVTHHAVNDCYAMGIKPSTAQVWANLKFSHPRLARRDFTMLMTGINQALKEHETKLIGGHSTEGAETHLALVVNGTGSATWPKNGIQQGDWLVLNKPIGSGILLAANMHGKAHALAMGNLWQHLLTSNKIYFEKIKDLPINAATDITGFGLLGHLLEMTEQTNCSINVYAQDIPLMTDVLALSEQGTASTLFPQLEPLKNRCDIQSTNQALVNCLLDPQTQGGLVISVTPEIGRRLLAAGDVWKIGEVTERRQRAITVI